MNNNILKYEKSPNDDRKGGSVIGRLKSVFNIKESSNSMSVAQHAAEMFDAKDNSDEGFEV